MRNRCSYAGLVSAYFSVYLAGTKNVSTNTIYSYRDTFVIFHGYLEKYCGFKLEKMLFNDLSRELILEFLQYLETERKCSISSRNQRLAALKSFAKYVQIECPDEMILCQRILSIDSKKAAKPTVQYLSNQQTDILMEQPDISTPKGRRDLAMILLLYDFSCTSSGTLRFKNLRYPNRFTTSCTFIREGAKKSRCSAYQTVCTGIAPIHL